jgi:cellulose synthase/poly-beta-1,6-N-acetylglucosamine synthase-like glycosyltransferase
MKNALELALWPIHNSQTHSQYHKDGDAARHPSREAQMMDESNHEKRLVSIVISAYNEAENIDELYRRLSVTLTRLSCCDFEIIFVNDGSTDVTLDRMMAYHKKDRRVNVVDFTRNFGHEK